MTEMSDGNGSEVQHNHWRINKNHKNIMATLLIQLNI